MMAVMSLCNEPFCVKSKVKSDELSLVEASKVKSLPD